MNGDFLFDMETFFLALADKTRLRLLNLMRGDEVCVWFFTEVLNAGQPKVSRHLAYLRKAGIVEARRGGKWMNYRIVKPQNEYAALILEDTLDWLESQESMRQDYEKLISIYRSLEAKVEVITTPNQYTLPKANIPASSREEMETFLL